MKLAFALCAVTLWALTASAANDPGSSTAAAETAARSWLALVDTGKYSDSWTAAATPFREKITMVQWQAAIVGARGPLGGLKSRTLVSATETHTLPGAPDGDYVVIQFNSSFEHKASAVETITPMKDTDGKWRVSGYYIK